MVNGNKLDVDTDAVRLELDRIVSSSVFSAARRSKMLLRYIVERSLAGSVPKEFEIAVEVMERGADYDPEVDAAVRVEASRLRYRLREYYATTGHDDPIFIDVPKGGYGAVFVSRGARTSASEKEYPSHQTLAPSATANPQLLNSPGPELEVVEMRPETGQVSQNEWLWLQSLKRSGRWWVGIGVAVTVIAAVFSWHAGKKRPAVGPIRSLAVLPLENLSGNAQEEYFVDGLTDALITQLAHTPDLRVVSRTSVMQYKGNRKPLRQIASELDVDAVVEGSVVRSGNRVRITAQLIDVRDDRHLWAQSYEEPIVDILILQDKVVREITLQTQAALKPGRERVHAERINPAAYDAYLRGLYFLNQRDIDKSVAYFQQAVALDSTYAIAYAGLAEALTTQGLNDGIAGPHEQSQALASAKRAIELDPESGEAYAALGLVEINFEKDWQAAGRDLEKGIALSPGNSLAEMQYSIYLDASARPEEAVSHMRRALQLDPRSFLMNRHLGVTLYFARHYDEALFYLQRAVEMEPTRAEYAQLWIARSYELTRRLDEAERTDLQLFAITTPETKLARLRLAYQRGGWKAYQTARIDLIGKQPRNGCDLYEIGESYIRLGNPDRAFSWLGRGIEAGCFWADSLPVDPLLDAIRSDPRFPDLLKMAHLEDVSNAATM
jgi:TolB-like protein/Tfp pilus assembly protein PilF